jgi:hypothetical protein
MGIVSRGFRGRRRPSAELPPASTWSRTSGPVGRTHPQHRLLDQDEPGFWESLGYHNYGDPWQEQRFWGDQGPGVLSKCTRCSVRLTRRSGSLTWATRVASRSRVMCGDWTIGTNRENAGALQSPQAAERQDRRRSRR